MTEKELEIISKRVDVLFDKEKITETEAYNVENLADIAYQLTRIADQGEPHQVIKDRMAECVADISSDPCTCGFHRDNYRAKPLAPDALVEGLREAIKFMEQEFFACQNDDCKCRMGFGLCAQCKRIIKGFTRKYKPLIAALESGGG